MICSKCKLDLALTAFIKRPEGLRGYTSACKACRSLKTVEWSKKNPKRRLSTARLWREKNPGYQKVWRAIPQNAEKARAACRAWQKANRPADAARSAEQRALMKTPAWADLDCIASLYELARIATQETGEEWQVDHIVPIRGRKVCGLHVETNLQLLTATANASKGNRYAVG